MSALQFAPSSTHLETTGMAATLIPALEFTSTEKNISPVTAATIVALALTGTLLVMLVIILLVILKRRSKKLRRDNTAKDLELRAYNGPGTSSDDAKTSYDSTIICQTDETTENVRLPPLYPLRRLPDSEDVPTENAASKIYVTANSPLTTRISTIEE